MNSLDRMVDKVCRDPAFLGWLLREYAQIDNLQDARLAEQLGCTPAQLQRMRLCRMPREAPSEFRTDIESIAAAFQIEPTCLATLVRRASVLVRLVKRSQSDQPRVFLMAARDAEESAGS